MNPNEDTEWNDILRQKGILPERPPSPTAQIEQALEEALENAHANRLDGKSLKELDEIDEDGLEDEEFVQQYREKRIRELQEQASRNKFGEVVRISKPEYSEEITNASVTAPVVVHISASGTLQSRLLNSILVRIAPRFKDIKFVEIDHLQINERFSLANTPTILLYKDGNLVDQLVTLATIGGNSTNVNDVETYLVRKGILSEADERLLANKDDSDYSD